MYDFFTIGYFQKSVADIGNMLNKYRVNAIADVRSSPFSRANPDFNRNYIQTLLDPYGIRYVFLGNELGARPKDRSCYREARADYDLIAKTSFFQKGLDRLETGRQSFRIALMCAERDPIICHRAILVSRYLEERGASIGHILHHGGIESHSDAMTRLIDKLGLANKAQEHHSLIAKHAYDAQGQKIAFQESREDNDERAENTPRML